jgi:thioredoxin-like negative regulator of GroEL
MAVLQVNNLDEFNKIIICERCVVAYFWVSWAGPCNRMSLFFESLSIRFRQFVFVGVNVDAAAVST